MIKKFKIATTLLLLMVYIPIAAIGSIWHAHEFIEAGDSQKHSSVHFTDEETSAHIDHADAHLCVACQMATASLSDFNFRIDPFFPIVKCIPSIQNSIFDFHTASTRKRGPPSLS